MVSVVNGYVCLSGCDAAAARRGADPRNPTGDPVKQSELDRRKPDGLASLALSPSDQAGRGASIQLEPSGNAGAPSPPDRRRDGLGLLLDRLV